MKRKAVLCLILTAAALLSFSACGETEEIRPPEEIPTVDQAEFDALEERIAAAEADREQYVYLINAQSDGETLLPLDGETELTICAVVPEGMKLSQWTVNGVSLNTLEESICLKLSENSIVKAEFRKVKKVECINCSLQFLDRYENNGGEMFTEFVFEDDYVNTLTREECAGGSMLLCVQANIPYGKAIDYWLVNGQKLNTYATPYLFNAYVTEATTFEPVFKDKPY